MWTIDDSIDWMFPFIQTSTLQALFRELILCQERQAFLLEQIQQYLPRSPSSSAFFLPLDTSSSQRSPPVSSLQDAFEQRKSSFIHQSKERVKQIYRHQKKSHQRIIPRLAQCNNSYLQEKRQSEYDRLCAMIIKHQNRQNAKIYGNFIKNRLCSEWIDLKSNWILLSSVPLLPSLIHERDARFPHSASCFRQEPATIHFDPDYF